MFSMTAYTVDHADTVRAAEDSPILWLEPTLSGFCSGVEKWLDNGNAQSNSCVSFSGQSHCQARAKLNLIQFLVFPVCPPRSRFADFSFCY